MDFTIRRAKREDCPEMMELIRELAVFERAPDEVTVDLSHFEDSGFGDRPVWWAFVACAPEAKAEAAAQEAAMPVQTAMPEAPSQTTVAETNTGLLVTAQTSADPSVSPVIRLDEPVISDLPATTHDILPLMMEARPCDRVIGFALYYIRYSTWKGQRMYLEDLLVTENWRGRGVGTALMDALIGAAKVERLHGISWQVLNWNEPAVRFYERYKARFDHEWVNAAIDV